MSWSQGRDTARAAGMQPGQQSPGLWWETPAESPASRAPPVPALPGALGCPSLVQSSSYPLSGGKKKKRGINEKVSTLTTKDHSKSFPLRVLNVLLLIQLSIKLFPQYHFPVGRKPRGLRCINPKLHSKPRGMARRCLECSEPPALGEPSRAPEPGRSPPASMGRRAATQPQQQHPCLLKTPDREGKKGGGCSQEKASSIR